MNTEDIPFSFEVERTKLANQWQSTIKTLRTKLDKLTTVSDRILAMDSSKGLTPLELANLQLFITQTLEGK